MLRRLLGPVSGPFMFFLVAALVFAGLGWVTVAALRVETAQREAAARAELGNNLRVALWRLDGRMLPALSVEDSRPFYHYSSPDPLNGSTTGPTPLVAAPLPEWMKLHVQLDSANGWGSPQVLSPDARLRVFSAWPQLPLRNITNGRAEVLNSLRDNYPPRSTLELLTARERANTTDDRPFAAPLVDPQPLPSGSSSPVFPPDSYTSKPPPPPEMNPVSSPDDRTSGAFRWIGRELQLRAEDSVANNTQNKEAPMKTPAFPPTAPPAGGAVGRSMFPPLSDIERQWSEYRNRSRTTKDALEDAKRAGQEFPQYGNNASNGAKSNAPTQSDQPQKLDKDKDGDKKETQGKNEKVNEAPKTPSMDDLHTPSDDERKRLLAEQGKPSVLEAAWAVAVAASGGKHPLRLVPPAEDRPGPTITTYNSGPNNTLTNNILLDGRQVNIHLGSMRPQWIAAANGTETLVLVRAVNLDGKTLYQGVILDWPKLEQVLKDEVKDLFPGAKLVPVRDAATVLPDRAMTALPVQLEPGTATEPPPAGWTPLRIGLVLAWLAALVAFTAVGFSGWSLIDLSERRIRFVSAVTHELRTPLTSLRLYLDLLTSGMIHDEAKRQEYLNTLATESDRLHRLIDNVLDFAKLEKRAKNGAMKPVKVYELTEQLQNTWADRVAADGKQLIVIATVAETEVVTDTAMVLQIVGNLIDNARKYTRDAEDNRIWLWVKPSANGRVVFEVEDRGCGVPLSERKSIFKPFRRGAHADTRAGGAGLGLALAKQWAEVLGGTVAYRPAEGASGACFRLELPVK